MTIWPRTDSLAASHAGVFGTEFAFAVLDTRDRSEFVGGEKDGTVKLGVALCCGASRVRGVELKNPRRGGERRLEVEEVRVDWGGLEVSVELCGGDIRAFFVGCSGDSGGGSDKVVEDIAVEALDSPGF